MVTLTQFHTIFYEKLSLCYNKRWSLLTSLFLANFCQIPSLYFKWSYCNANIFPPYYIVPEMYVVFDLWTKIPRARCANKGSGGSCRPRKFFVWVSECARKIIQVHDLLCQSNHKTRVSVWFVVPWGNGDTSYVGHAKVRPRDQNCNPDINPITYLLKGFLEFCLYESTQICEYDQCILPKNSGINIKRCYCVIVYVGHFLPSVFSPISVESLLYSQIFCFCLPFCQEHMWISLRILSLFFVTERVYTMPEWVSVCESGWGGGSVWGRNILCGCERNIIMACDLLLQSKAQSWVPSRIPVLQGIGEAIFMDNLGLQPCDDDWNTSINTATHLQNGFIHFRWHELNQTYEYN